MKEATITTRDAGGDRIALAGKALEEIRNFAARMGGGLCTGPDASPKIDVDREMIFITVGVKLPVSSLSEYIGRQESETGVKGIFKLPTARKPEEAVNP
jgi:hypothetical protein